MDILTPMETVKIVNQDGNQCIHLPESLAFQDLDVYATRFGDALILIPKKSARELTRLAFQSFSSDVFAEGIEDVPLPGENL